MSRFRHGALLSGCVLSVTSSQVKGSALRRETSKVDGVTFFRFTLNPGLSAQFQTFWSEDEAILLRAVYRRLGLSHSM